MKTRLFFLLCLLFGIGLTQFYAQSPKSFILTWEGPYETAAVCNGQEVDYVIGTAKWHIVVHSLDVIVIGLPVWVHYTVDGEAESTKTHELFKIKEVSKQDFILFNQVFHFNLIGNKGSHYILSATIDFSTGIPIYTINKAICVENGR